MKFLADAMLGSVARKLRIIGFDTAYMADTDDDQVLKHGIEQGRVILTADRELFKRITKENAAGVLVEGKSDLEDMVHIFEKLHLVVDTAAIGSRCTACNGRLVQKVPSDVEGKVPKAVLRRYDQFHQCPDCLKVYWDGSHMGRIHAFAIKLQDRLAGSKG